MKFLGSVFVFLAATSYGICAGVDFPNQRSCMSPGLRWRIRCETEKQGAGYLHRLFLSRFLSSKEEAIFASGRCCDALWNDDDQTLAITDWSGSSVAEIYLIEVSQPSRATPLVVRDLEKIAQKAELEGHCYYEALKWEAPHQLQIRIFGHTDENPSHGFAYYLSVDTVSGTTKILKQESEEPDLISEKKKPVTL